MHTPLLFRVPLSSSWKINISWRIWETELDGVLKELDLQADEWLEQIPLFASLGYMICNQDSYSSSATSYYIPLAIALLIQFLLLWTEQASLCCYIQRQEASNNPFPSCTLCTAASILSWDKSLRFWHIEKSTTDWNPYTQRRSEIRPQNYSKLL